jgi:L-ribulose-5-phosphate 4-epimerase
MLECALREDVVQCGLKLLENQLVTMTMGNVSEINRTSGLIAIKPSGIEYPLIKAADVVILDMDGKIVDGKLTPSSEWPMHIAVYKARADVNAVVHTHSAYATAFAITWQEIPVTTSELAAIVGGSVQVAEFAGAGTHELGAAAVKALGPRDAVLLRNHGVLAVGATMARALYAAAAAERAARLACFASDIGKIHTLPEDEQMRERSIWLHSYGQK